MQNVAAEDYLDSFADRCLTIHNINNAIDVSIGRLVAFGPSSFDAAEESTVAGLTGGRRRRNVLHFVLCVGFEFDLDL